MLDKNKSKSIDYWNSSSGTWKNIAYSPDGNLTVFPSSQIRNGIVISELSKMKKDKKILDIGCADGKLIREMLDAGFTYVKGVDNSPDMISEAKRILKKDYPNLNPDDIFFVADADGIVLDENFDVITAIGLIEYVKDINLFISKVYDLLKHNGIAFIESRNKLFNIFSANEYTSNIKDMPNLIRELDLVKKFSPIQSNSTDAVVLETMSEIANGLSRKDLDSDIKKKSFKKYPFELPQYTPLEFVDLCKEANLKMKEVVYYHCHPFAPRYGIEFPQLFNKIGVLMQPLGYTPIGAIIGSAFVSKIEKC
ncbi:class I SAM-dependent methyltransferase [Candidatus Thioglobus sp.]|nr:class I SAM-dependent methyltransferase [Candidatus Thioglobus sp.]